jgi:hypothetical protein
VDRSVRQNTAANGRIMALFLLLLSFRLSYSSSRLILVNLLRP